MRGNAIVLVVVVVVALVLCGAGIASFWLVGGGAGGASFEPRADPALMATAAPRVVYAETLAATAAADCLVWRGGPAPASPALSSPLATARGVLGIRVECLFEDPPGSGNATGSGYEDVGRPIVSDLGAWSAWGADGWLYSGCHGSGEDCTELRRSRVDPSFAQIRVVRRFAGVPGWTVVTVSLEVSP